MAAAKMATTTTRLVLLGFLLLQMNPLLESNALNLTYLYDYEVPRRGIYVSPLNGLRYIDGRAEPRAARNLVDFVLEPFDNMRGGVIDNWVDDVNFHHIRDKDLPSQLDTHDIRSDSPRTCAESAMEKGVNFAVWREGRCYFKRTESCDGLLTSTFAEPLGNYNLAIPNSKNTTSTEVRNDWVRRGSCDVIQQGYGCEKFDSGKPVFPKIFWQFLDFYACKQFSPSPGTVMMFQRSKIEDNVKSGSQAVVDLDASK